MILPRTLQQSSLKPLVRKGSRSITDIKRFDEKPVNLGAIKLSSPLGVGCASWGDPYIWEYDASKEESLYQGFVKVIESGVNFFDTAEIYGKGQSEIILGRFRNRYLKSHPNAQIVVATKFLPLPWKISVENLHKSLDDSLSRLDMSSVDLYQIHASASSVRSVETWAQALTDAHKKGKIKELGVSNYSAAQVRRTHAYLQKQGLKLASNQIELSLIRNNPLHNGVAETCKELGVAMIAYSPLSMGILSGKYSSSNPPPRKRMLGKSANMNEVDALMEVLKEIGARYEKTPSQVALNWVICKGAIPIVGVRNEKQAEDNLGAVGWRLNEEDVAKLDSMSKSGSPWNIWQD